MIPVFPEPDRHLLLELHRSLVETIHSFAKFEHTVWRAGITRWWANVNVHIIQHAMKKSLHNVGLIHMPLLRGGKQKQKAIIPTRENRRIVFVLKIVLTKNLTMTTDNKPGLRRTIPFPGEDPLSLKTTVPLRELSNVKALSLSISGSNSPTKARESASDILRGTGRSLDTP